MRNADYRGYNEHIGWVYGSKETRLDGTPIIRDKEGVPYPIVPASLGINITNIAQYDGHSLTDKKGKEVFEGDILEKGGERVVIVWNPKVLRFDFRDKDYNFVAGCTPETISLCEVLGTLYQNPLLLG